MAEDGYAGIDGRYGGYTAGVIEIHKVLGRTLTRSPCWPFIDEKSWLRSDQWKQIIVGLKPVDAEYRPTETSRAPSIETFPPRMSLSGIYTIRSSVSVANSLTFFLRAKSYIPFFKYP